MSEQQPPYGARRVSGSYRLDVPRWVLLGILQRNVGTYSREMALVSYMLDVDAGTVKSIREYARIWGWSKKKVELQLPELREEVETWSGTTPEKGAARRGTARGQQGDSDGTEGGENGAESPNRGTARGQLRDSNGTHTKQPQPQKKNGGVGDAGAREGTGPPEAFEIDPFNPAFGYPQRDDVVAFAMQQGASAELADDLFHSFTAAGWKNKNDRMYEHWGHAIISAIRYRANRRTNGHAAHQPGSKPQSDYERRRAGVDLAEHERNLEAIRRGDIGLTPRSEAPGSDAELEGRTAVRSAR